MDDAQKVSLTAFLAARLNEDEATARACQSPSPWTSATHESDSWIVTDATGEPVIYDEGTPSLEDAAHIARHDPARALREVGAQREILAEHEAVVRLATLTEQELGFLGRYREWVLKNLAAAWSDHPDYRLEWKP